MSFTGKYPPIGGGGGGGGGITELTDDVTAVGPGAVPATIAAIQGTAVSGTTGTTNVVFSNGPTLVAPVLGTPASGDLSNCTGIPAAGITGTLGVDHGGTGATSLTPNGVVIGNGTGAVTVTAEGATGKVLTGVTGGDPVWSDPATAGTVTSVDVSGGTTGLTTTGGPITSSGTITLTGTLGVANGGTGVTASTGSVAVVLSTSPTLVTPVIGAATGTSLSVSGQLTSTVATGTAPLVVSSTTLVPNLYVDRAVIADSATTNANLTGPITSVGNATAVAAQTGTGSTFVMDASPTLVTPNIGVATATSINKVSITAPATAATLALADGSSLGTVGAFTTTFTMTAGTAVTFPTSGTLATTALATIAGAAGLYQASLAPANATGTPIGTGYIGEKITATVGGNTTLMVSGTTYPITSSALNLDKGIYMVYGRTRIAPDAGTTAMTECILGLSTVNSSIDTSYFINNLGIGVTDQRYMQVHGYFEITADNTDLFLLASSTFTTNSPLAVASGTYFFGIRIA